MTTRLYFDSKSRYSLISINRLPFLAVLIKNKGFRGQTFSSIQDYV